MYFSFKNYSINLTLNQYAYLEYIMNGLLRMENVHPSR